jgi:biotin carboxyl carrier protein
MERAERSGIVVRVIAAGLFLASCAGPAAQPVAPAEPAVTQAIVTAPPVVTEAPPPPPAQPESRILKVDVRSVPQCSTEATQGGAILCRAPPDAALKLDGKPIARADKDGLAVIGLSRTQASPAVISLDLQTEDGIFPVSVSVPVLPRHDTVTSFTMECGKIAPQSAEDKRKAEVAWLKKDSALKSFNDPQAEFALQGPVRMEGVVYSSSFGATRTYVPRTKACEPKTNVHNGADIAVGTGTKILAPMAGTVILADPSLFYEGGCVFLDLGRGLVSVTMHMSRIDVKPGDKVEQGQLLGLSGATGSVTGPHLHWAIKYRNVFSEDRGTDIWLDPMLLMNLKAPG